jgi:hypothetical protein
MPTSKRRHMDKIDEERFKKADELLIKTQRQFLTEGHSTPFTAFVDKITYDEIWGHVTEHWEDYLGKPIKNENGKEFIKYGNWIIYCFYSTVTNGEKIRMLMFPHPGVYCITE